MRNMNKYFLVGLSALVLAGCASNEEMIEVDKPDQSMPSRIDLTTGETYGNDSDFMVQTAHGVSSSGVEIFSLDGPGANLKAGDAAYAAARPSGHTIGNSSVEISPIGQPNLTYAQDLKPREFRGAPAARSAPDSGNFVNIAAPGEPMVRIYFDHDSSELDESDVQKISSISQKYNPNPGQVLSVEGHASMASSESDPVQRKAVNLKVSMERAYAVARALMHTGVPANSIRTVAWGEERPVPPTGEMDSESASRRVEILSISGQ